MVIKNTGQINVLGAYLEVVEILIENIQIDILHYIAEEVYIYFEF